MPPAYGLRHSALCAASCLLLLVVDSGCDQAETSAAAAQPMGTTPLPPLETIPTAEPENVVEKCQQLKKVMDRGVAAVDEGMASLSEDPSSVAAMQKMASTVSASGREAVAVKAMDNELQALTTEYLNVTQGIYKSITALSDSLREEDLQRTQNAQQELGVEAAKTKPVVEKLAKACSK